MAKLVFYTVECAIPFIHCSLYKLCYLYIQFLFVSIQITCLPFCINQLSALVLLFKVIFKFLVIDADPYMYILKVHLDAIYILYCICLLKCYCKIIYINF